MPIKREAKYLSGADIGKTVACYDRIDGSSYTMPIVAVEQWPDAVLVHLPPDVRRDPVTLDPTQTVTITGKESHGKSD